MKGQAPLTLSVDPSVMTPEDRDAYEKARVAVGGMENPDMPKGPMRGQIPLEGMGQELVTGGERLSRGAGPEIPAGAQPGQLPLGGMGQELPVGGERLPKGAGEGPRMTGPDVFTPPEL